MFERLSDGFQSAFKHLTGRAILSETNIDDAMREIRIALLEADVNINTVKEFVAEARERCLGEKVLKNINPSEQAIKVVNDLLTEMMGEENAPLELSSSPSVIMMVGLHGSGKTTTTAKLANLLKSQNKKVMLVAADVMRPAAIDQLEFLGKQLTVPVFADREEKNVVKIANYALSKAKEENIDVVIVDTAGRLQIDTSLVQELVSIKNSLIPDEILLVADSALGQESVSVASHFHEALGITGIILTKFDGDARGGAALSMRKLTGKPIKFIGVGEKIEDLDAFHPERMASRILGMGDVVSLVEKATAEIDEQEAKQLEKKMLSNTFNLNDFIKQIKMLRKIGGMSFLLDMMPGGKKIKEQVNIDEGQLEKTEAIICSMTHKEKEKPDIINLSRRRRIAKGSGTPQREVDQLLKRFSDMRKIMSKFTKMSKAMGGALPDMGSLLDGGANNPLGAGVGGGFSPFSGMQMPSLSSSSTHRELTQKEKKKKRKQQKNSRKKNKRRR